jgi:hypothetical protein
MLISNNPSLKEKLLPFCLQVKPFAENKMRMNDLEFARYQRCSLLQGRQNEVINYYLALSVETLRYTSRAFHSDECIKFDRSISGQEDLVFKLVDKTIQIPCVRQLLIGGKNSDLYLPSIHICLEPASDRYNSLSKRSRADDHTDKERWFMNDLHSIRIEDYKGKQLYYVIEELRRTRSFAPLNIQSNMFVMAIRTLPRFIPYNQFLLLMGEMPRGTRLKSSFH